MTQFRYTGQHPMEFEVFGHVEPDEILEIGSEYVEKFRHRSDMECLDYDDLAEVVALHESDKAAEDAARAGAAVVEPRAEAPEHLKEEGEEDASHEE